MFRRRDCYSHSFDTFPSSLILAREEKIQVSTAIKILKILSFIFFPIVLIALAIRYFLHKKFDAKINRKYFYIPEGVTKEEERILAAHPDAVKEAAQKVFPSFYYFPKKYQTIKVKSPEEGQAPKITFSVNINLLLNDLNIDSINWPTSHLYDDLDFTGHPEEEVLVNKIREIEGKDSERLSLESKKLLTLHFLKQIFNESGITRTTCLPFTYNKDKYGDKQTIWYQLYFNEEDNEDYYSGGLIYNRLLDLGLDLRENKSPLLPDCFDICWENVEECILKSFRFIQK